MLRGWKTARGRKARPKTQRMIAEKSPVRHSRAPNRPWEKVNWRMRIGRQPGRAPRMDVPSCGATWFHSRYS